ncbi:MAG: DNA starvation/stationary phase protection protein [Bacteroidales bacterium]|nr:DNA starvation/stationary phase protection protein [Bacteroidales bacterium]
MNRIGLNTESSKNLAEKLNDLLANYQIFYMNTRGLHWNIKGEKFFELHAKFEELYNDLFLKIDEIAERILTLAEAPYHSYTQFLEVSEVKEAVNVTGAKESVQSILDAFKILLKKQREILNLSGDADDEGTNALMSDYIREQEKLVWMYSAFMA